MSITLAIGKNEFGHVTPDYRFDSRYHRGDFEFYRHLYTARNFTRHTESDDRQEIIRPIDFDYALSWVSVTSCLSTDNRERLKNLLQEMIYNPHMWLIVKGTK